jgi:hypothetical protein
VPGCDQFGAFPQEPTSLQFTRVHYSTSGAWDIRGDNDEGPTSIGRAFVVKGMKLGPKAIGLLGGERVNDGAEQVILCLLLGR